MVRTKFVSQEFMPVLAFLRCEAAAGLYFQHEIYVVTLNVNHDQIRVRLVCIASAGFPLHELLSGCLCLTYWNPEKRDPRHKIVSTPFQCD